MGGGRVGAHRRKGALMSIGLDTCEHYVVIDWLEAAGRKKSKTRNAKRRHVVRYVLALNCHVSLCTRNSLETWHAHVGEYAIQHQRSAAYCCSRMPGRRLLVHVTACFVQQDTLLQEHRPVVGTRFRWDTGTSLYFPGKKIYAWWEGRRP